MRQSVRIGDPPGEILGCDWLLRQELVSQLIVHLSNLLNQLSGF
jgi:hypothetical protein